MEGHRNIVRLFKPDGPQQVLPAAGRGGNIHRLLSFTAFFGRSLFPESTGKGSDTDASRDPPGQRSAKSMIFIISGIVDASSV